MVSGASRFGLSLSLKPHALSVDVGVQLYR